MSEQGHIGGLHLFAGLGISTVVGIGGGKYAEKDYTITKRPVRPFRMPLGNDQGDRWDLNPHPLDPQSNALPVKLLSP